MTADRPRTRAVGSGAFRDHPTTGHKAECFDGGIATMAKDSSLSANSSRHHEM